MTFFSFLLLRYFLSIFLSSGLACVVCCVFFHFLFCLSYPDLVSSCGKPDYKKNKSDAWDRDRLYNPFAFAGVSVVSPLTTFHSKTYPSDSSWAAQLRRGQISVLVSWVVNTFWRRLIIDDMVSLSFFETWDLLQASKANYMGPPFSAWILSSSKSKSKSEFDPFQFRYPTQTIISLHPLTSGVKSPVARFSSLLHYTALLLL